MTKCVEEVRSITHHVNQPYQDWEEVSCDSPSPRATGALGIWTPEQQLPGFVSEKKGEGGSNKARK